MQSTKLAHEFLWISKVKVIHWPLSKVTQIQHFQTSFPKKNTRPIEGIFHVEPSWDGRMKVSINGLGQMTKMAAAMPIYAKKYFKIFFCGTERPMNLTLGMQRRVLEYYQVYSNDALGWHWPILRQGQIWSAMLLYGKNLNNGLFKKFCGLWYKSR